MKLNQVFTLVFFVLCLMIITACGSQQTVAPQGGEHDDSHSLEGHEVQEESRDLIRFGVGPVLPTPEETRQAFTPFFSYLADELGFENFELQETTEWAGIGVALASEQVDVAWMGPWGYILAYDRNPGIEAIATVKYDDIPTYKAIMVSQPGSGIEDFPWDAEGKSLTLADTGSTSGWLIPMYHFNEWGIDPNTFFSEFSEGGTHSANEIAVVEGHVDLASDFDRHRNALIASGHIQPDATEVVWESEPLPNDAIAVRPGISEDIIREIQEILVNLSKEQAEELLPDNYTGFVQADHSSYQLIEEAGIAVGRIERK